MHKLLLPALLFTLVACEGPEGPAGEDGIAGEAGSDGINGDNGEDGLDGEDAACAGREAVEITAITGGEGTLYTDYPTTLSIATNSSEELSYNWVGYGIDYVFNGDDVEATAFDVMASSQVLVATDGCTVDTFLWEPELGPGTFILDVVHLTPGVGAVDVGVSGADPAFNIGFEERVRLELPWGDYGWDISQEGAVALSVPSATYAPGTHYVVYAHLNSGALAVSAVNADLSAPSDPSGQIRLTGVHAADGVGPVDVYDIYSASQLFDELTLGTPQTAEDVALGEYGLAIDLDNDGVTDLDLGRLDSTGIGGEHVLAAAYLDESGTPKIFATVLGADVDAVVSTVVEVSSAPGLDFSNSSPISDSLSVGSCPEIAGVQVEVDVTHTYRGDVSMYVTSPDGTEVSLWSGSGGSTDDIVGLFDATAGVDYVTTSSSSFTISSLSDFVGEDGGGDWQIDLSDFYSGDDGTLNAWTVLLSCPL